MVTFVLLVVVLGGMVCIHEFGHFIVARFFKIEVEEFGFGIPPRVWRFWRSKGHLVIGGQSVQIPANFDLPFETQNGLHEEANATADMVNDQLVLRTIALVRADKMLRTARPVLESNDGLRLKNEYLPAEKASTPEPVTADSETLPGAIALSGVLSEVSPGTEVTLNALPLGGFVRPKGENDPSVPDGLAAANPWKRLAVLFAGPFMNLLTAVVVASIIIIQTGIAVPGTLLIHEVTPNSPASQAGLQANDIIRTINGAPVSDIAATITLIRKNLDKPVVLGIERGGQQLNITATPLSSRSVEQGALGIALGYPTRPASPVEAITGGFSVTGAEAAALIYLPIGFVQGVITPDQVHFSGLKGMYDVLNSAVQQDAQTRQQTAQVPASGNNSSTPPPSDDVLFFIVLLSVTLGIFNLFPIPALDGGRILFTLPEILFRRRIPTRLENTVNAIAFFLLIGLMVYVNVMDFVNPMKLP